MWVVDKIFMRENVWNIVQTCRCRCVWLTVCVWLHGHSFESEAAKRAAPAASINRWKAPFSTALITVSAALLGSDKAGLHAANQILWPGAASLCHPVAWSLISHGATPHRSPISYSKAGRYGNPPSPTSFTTSTPLPFLVRWPTFIDHKSPSLAALIVNHPQWHYRSGPSAAGLPSALSPHCSQGWAVSIPPPQIQYWGLFIDNSFIVL